MRNLTILTPRLLRGGVFSTDV